MMLSEIVKFVFRSAGRGMNQNIGIMRKKEDSRLVLDMEAHGIDVFAEFGYYNYTSVQPYLPVHNHGDALEICYLARGRQNYSVGNEDFEVRGGDIFVAYPGESHGSGTSPEEKGALYWLVLRRPAGEAGYLGLGGEESVELFRCLESLPCRLFRGSVSCRELLQEIVRRYFSEDTLMTRIILENLLVSFLLEVIRCSGDRGRRCCSRGIESVLEHIEENLDEPCSLEALAERCNLSLSRFKHLFKEETGISPMEYVNRRKIDKAVSMLTDSGMSVKDIAYSLGFSSPSYFSTVFRQYKGYAPAMHRRLSGKTGG